MCIEFFRSLFAEPVYNEIETHFKRKWSKLDEAYVNFSHWSLVKAAHDDLSYTKTGFLALWHRHVAVLCKAYFPNLDLIIPMAYRAGENFRMSYILMSVKNKTSGNENLRDPFMSTSSVEGTSAGKSSRKNNHYLGLKQLKFVVGSEECWVKHTAANPFVAMVLSMGDTERTEKLVAIEEPSVSYLNPELSDNKSTNADRIVFAIHGFKATYRFPTPHVENAMTDILVRHDVSGEFPELLPTNPVERVLADKAQQVDGDFHGLIEQTEAFLQEKTDNKSKKKQDLDEETGNPPSNDDKDPNLRMDDTGEGTLSKVKRETQKKRKKK